MEERQVRDDQVTRPSLTSRRRLGGLRVLAAGLSLTGISFGFQLPASEIPNAGSRRIDQPELVIVADSDDYVKPSEIAGMVRLSALRVYRKKVNNPGAELAADAVRIRRISKDDFNTLERLLIDGIAPASDRQSTGPVLRPLVRQQKDEWELDLGGNYLLRKLTIRLRDTKANKDLEPVVIDPAKSGGDDPARKITKKAVGVYDVRLSLPEGVVVSSYSVIRTDAEGNDLPEVNVPMDREDAHWVIHIEGFDLNDRKPLFEDLASEERTNPVRGLREVPSRHYVLGSMKLVLGIGTTSFTKSSVTFRINDLNRRKPKSAYMLFPLTADRARELAKEYNTSDSFELPSKVLVNPSPATEKDFGIEPGMQPRWFEIARSEDGHGFERTIQIKDVPRWKSMGEKDQRLWRLLIWVGEEEGKKIVNRVPDPEYRSRGPGDTPPQVLVVAEEVGEWPVGIKSLEENQAEPRQP